MKQFDKPNNTGFFNWLKNILVKDDIDIEIADPNIGKQLTVIYGTQTGNAQTIAEQTVSQAKSIGIDVALRDMEDIDVSMLADIDHILIVISTFDNGGMPENAELLWESIFDRSAPMLNGVKYAVLGLGDSTYLNFCQAGKDWDIRLEELGCQRIMSRVDCDVDYEESSKKWINQVLAIISAKYGKTIQIDKKKYSNGIHKYIHNSKSPFTAKLKSKELLTKLNSTKEVIHYVLDISNSNENYQEGDTIYITPKNNKQLVKEILDYFNIKTDHKDYQNIKSALTNNLEIRSPSQKLIALITNKPYNPETIKLSKLLKNNNTDALNEYLLNKDSLELIKSCTEQKISINDFMDTCNPLVARAYSISSSITQYADEVHITVRSVRYNHQDRQHNGVASTYLADILEKGDEISCYFSTNPNFKLPKDDNTSIIMVGPGTGVAPFRSFLQNRLIKAKNNQDIGDSWLFFGERNIETDFLYQNELIAMQDNGILTKLSLAFSRDQENKSYVQDIMQQEGQELFTWLKNGSYFYVCGDAHMAKDVDKILHGIVAKYGKMSNIEAITYVDQLKRSKRYVKDVY